MRLTNLISWSALQIVPLLAAGATPMTMREFEGLCGDGRAESRECVLYVEGLIDGAMKRMSEEALRCSCPPSPSMEEARKELSAKSSDGTLFLIQHPFETFGACVSPEERGAALDPSKVAIGILAKYQEARRQAPESNLLPLNPPSTFLVWVLVDEAKKSCEKKQ